jgi:adenosine deaminase
MCYEGRAMSVPRAVAVIAVLVAALAVPAPAVAQREPVQGELRANAELSAVRGDPLALHVFLKRMPKGADLHSHLHSAVYAETLTKPQSIREDAPLCAEGAVPAATAYKDQRLYNGSSEGVTGHDHFFGTFQKFGGTNPNHTGEWLDEVANRAAGQNMQYLKLMATPTWNSGILCSPRV